MENIHINPTGKGHKSQVDAYFYQSVLPQGPKRWPAVLDELTTLFQRMSRHSCRNFFQKVVQSSHTSTNNRKMALLWMKCVPNSIRFWKQRMLLIDNANFLNEGNNFFSAEYQQVSKLLTLKHVFIEPTISFQRNCA